MPKLPISALPLPTSARILTHNLTPDTATALIASAFRDVLKESPSIQRRSRLLDSGCHFSRVTPLPLEFPYRIAPPEDGKEVEDKEEYVENWLSSHEPLEERSLASTPSPGVLKKYSCAKRDGMERILIGLSDTCLRDCFPHLAVGDAFVELDTPTLSMKDPGGNDLFETPRRKVAGDQAAARQELVDVLSGHSVLMSIDGSEPGYTPWSLRYSGHQFGTWAGQLGDGRAVSILETPHPTSPCLSYELQLKGAGRTPFARSADGLAVLRSSIREYLCAEAMHALHIPTTRSLALVHLPKLEVYREEVETACVLTRVAPSFLRIGSFEALNPPERQRMVFYGGGGQQDANWDALRVLGEWVAGPGVLNLGLKEGEKWGKALVFESARRNARMVAGWQVYGFMHGVINTDNVSVMGLTIDYGPYAFMDIYDPMHICNHSDSEGRYAYKFQPTMIVFALNALLRSLAPLIGAEEELGSAVKSGWAADASPEKLEEWRAKGLSLEAELKAEIERVFEEEHWKLYRKRLGLTELNPSDPDELIHPLLALMRDYKLDFHSTFRKLCFFRPSKFNDPESSKAFIENLLVPSTSFEGDKEKAIKDLIEWLQKFATRISAEVKTAEDEEKREKAMLRANPRFILRQWLLEEIIKRVQDDVHVGKRALAKVHEMATKPFEPWGAELKVSEDSLTPEEKEERRYCGMGSTKMLGFQCSCSS
ncbi:UPF0061-domain-containing protein [Schizopora paradoxa]|uniref:Selenoprotein O n=1 Tax=Schizopora paradoxa TaxID=27342 RepID=A0A0H2S0B4_9AGAM|nr:UPF0061-domain-containing protein [Schizopora paradoxa]